MRHTYKNHTATTHKNKHTGLYDVRIHKGDDDTTECLGTFYTIEKLDTRSHDKWMLRSMTSAETGYALRDHETIQRFVTLAECVKHCAVRAADDLGWYAYRRALADFDADERDDAARSIRPRFRPCPSALPDKYAWEMEREIGHAGRVRVERDRVPFHRHHERAGELSNARRWAVSLNDRVVGYVYDRGTYYTPGWDGCYDQPWIDLRNSICDTPSTAAVRLLRAAVQATVSRYLGMACDHRDRSASETKTRLATRRRGA